VLFILLLFSVLFSFVVVDPDATGVALSAVAVVVVVDMASVVIDAINARLVAVVVVAAALMVLCRTNHLMLVEEK